MHDQRLRRRDAMPAHQLVQEHLVRALEDRIGIVDRPACRALRRAARTRRCSGRHRCVVADEERRRISARRSMSRRGRRTPPQGRPTARLRRTLQRIVVRRPVFFLRIAEDRDLRRLAPRASVRRSACSADELRRGRRAGRRGAAAARPARPIAATLVERPARRWRAGRRAHQRRLHDRKELLARSRRDARQDRGRSRRRARRGRSRRAASVAVHERVERVCERLGSCRRPAGLRSSSRRAAADGRALRPAARRSSRGPDSGRRGRG